MRVPYRTCFVVVGLFKAKTRHVRAGDGKWHVLAKLVVVWSVVSRLRWCNRLVLVCCVQRERKMLEASGRCKQRWTGGVERQSGWRCAEKCKEMECGKSGQFRAGFCVVWVKRSKPRSDSLISEQADRQ